MSSNGSFRVYPLLLSSNNNLFITCVASLIIIGTVLGNILVIVAVCVEPRLRKVGNLFIVNLALSDLLVGVAVTPIALMYQLLGEWRFGSTVCNFWISMDVICCTASIVNLCVISFDRYNAITRPLVYALKRTPLRATCMIGLVWIYSCVIALPPLLGWKDKLEDTPKLCHISQHRGYTIFSTTGAFYFPLLAMIVLYGKVFKATLKRRKHWVAGPCSSRMKGDHRLRKWPMEASVLINATNSIKRRLEQERAKEKERQVKIKKSKAPPVNPHIGYRLMKNGHCGLFASSDSLSDLMYQATHSPVINNKYQNQRLLGGYKNGQTISEVHERKRLAAQLSSTTTTETTSISYELSIENYAGEIRTRCARVPTLAEIPNGRETQSKMPSPPLPSKQPSDDGNADAESAETDTSTPTTNHLVRYTRQRRRRKGKISISQEKRAAKTLGIIMGCFVICWLPFFIVALMRPFCATCSFHPIMISVFTWLGYCNSALNPIIYTFFNADFRKAFKKVLFCTSCQHDQRNAGL